MRDLRNCLPVVVRNLFRLIALLCEVGSRIDTHAVSWQSMPHYPFLVRQHCHVAINDRTNLFLSDRITFRRNTFPCITVVMWVFAQHFWEERSLHVVTCCYDSLYQFGYCPKYRCWLARNYHVHLWTEFVDSIIWLCMCHLHLRSLLRPCDLVPGYSRSRWPCISGDGRKLRLALCYARDFRLLVLGTSRI